MFPAQINHTNSNSQPKSSNPVRGTPLQFKSNVMSPHVSKFFVPCPLFSSSEMPLTSSNSGMQSCAVCKVKRTIMGPAIIAMHFSSLFLLYAASMLLFSLQFSRSTHTLAYSSHLSSEVIEDDACRPWNPHNSSNFTIDVGRANGARCDMGPRTHLKTTLALSFTFLKTSASTFHPSPRTLWFSCDAPCQRASEVCLSHGPTLDVHCSRRGPPHRTKHIFRHAFSLQTWSDVACFWPAISSGSSILVPSKWFFQKSSNGRLAKAHCSSVKATCLSNKFKSLHHPRF